MCTNRLSALDPAVKRRAADILRFERPNDEQRLAVLKESFQELGLSEMQLKEVVSATGRNGIHEYGFTFSDLTQRLLPAIILDAYPNKPVTGQRAMEIASEMSPTPPFIDK